MIITFRTDASFTIGTGHVMRCLTLANKLRLRENDVNFICRKEPGNLVELLQQKGYDVQLLPSGIDIDTDRKLTKELLEQTSPDWLIVDHYDIDAAWESSIRSAVGKIMVIDDLADRKHDCDLLLDQSYNNDHERYDQLVPSTCTKLLGLEFALLHPQFAVFSDACSIMRERTGEIRRILVFMGGADPENQTFEALRAIKMLGRPDIATDVIVGVTNKHRSEIKSLASTIPNTSCYYNIGNMADLMNAADLSIGAGGMTTWERCGLGLPSIIVPIAKNQVSIVDNLVEAGVVIKAGWFRDITAEELAVDLKFLLRHRGIVRQMSLNAQQLVDCKGTTRVANCIISSPGHVTLRPVTKDDCFNMYEWRTHPDVSRYSFHTAPLPREEHEKWFMNALSSQKTALLIGEINEKPAGVLRYDLDKDTAAVSIYVVPGHYNRGIGTELLKAGNAWIQKNCSTINNIKAEIVPQNIISIRAFQKAGFEESHLIFIKKLTGDPR